MIWNDILRPAMEHPKMVELKKHLKNERDKGKVIYPESKDIFRAFNLVPFDSVRVCILGQDPASDGSADGLCFSTRRNETPRTLGVIFKEVYRDLNVQYFQEESYEDFFPTNSLENWAREGFLLLNTVLTVEEGKPGSHKDLGWEILIKSVLDGLNKKEEPIIFLLWGRYAQSFRPGISKHHLVLTAPYPSAKVNSDSKGTFTGCGHLSAVRDILPTLKKTELFKVENLNACFDKVKAKAILREKYPENIDTMIDYIDKEMMINIPVNKEEYWKYLRKFETSLSTKIKS